MRPMYFIYGLLVGMCVGISVFLVASEEAIGAALDYVSLVAFFLVAVAIGGFGGFFTLRKMAIKKIGLKSSPAVGSLVDQGFRVFSPDIGFSSQQRYEEIQELTKGSFVWVLSSLGFLGLVSTVVAVVAIFAGSVASLLLFKQNELISEQIKSGMLQTVFAESARRSVQYGSVNELSAKIRNPDSHFLHEGEPQMMTLYPEILQEVEVFLSVLQPYPTATFNARGINLDATVEENVEVAILSPERGQIFNDLVSLSGVYPSTGFIIRGDFSMADARGIKIPKMEVNGERLGGDFRLQARNQFLTSLRYDCDYEDDILDRLVLRTSLPDLVDFTESDLNGVDFRDSSLRNVAIPIMDGAKVDGASFFNSVIFMDGKPEGQMSLVNSLLIVDSEGPTGFSVEVVGGCVVYDYNPLPFDELRSLDGIRVTEQGFQRERINVEFLDVPD